ncbi:hypothetical protein SAMN06265375_1057 [Muriicola jejuensis]|uniref:Calx-beta domain-containing protein n=1 Tax=Muriicola jejuensis TaxID=504488 RepID=A0A6P0UEQ7_9FLAO|nr:motile sperm domain-containing protein [Muriicola jejuensis]NER11744.1 hypothetical protein [Muriicola jejuensis]SMP24809.1 hypothetical protein SAMN06265375_1057 [Muriicola jejuensis]
MKKYISLIVLAFVALTSCEEDLLVYDTPDGFIQLSAESGSITEDAATSIVTQVLLGRGTNESGVTVSFSVTSSDPSRYVVSPSTGTIDIPAGEFSADIEITPIDNFAADGDLDVVIELSSGNSLPIGIGGEGGFNTTRTITIIDNDCPVDINAFVGTFTVFENFTAGVNSPNGLSDFFNESYQVELALAPGDTSGTKVVITNSVGFNEYIPDGTVMTFLACSGTVSFDAGFPRVGDFRTFAYTDSSYDEVAGVIQCTGPLATFGPYQFTFTRQ